jgi:hypothetical protein
MQQRWSKSNLRLMNLLQIMMIAPLVKHRPRWQDTRSGMKLVGLTTQSACSFHIMPVHLHVCVRGCLHLMQVLQTLGPISSQVSHLQMTIWPCGCQQWQGRLGSLPDHAARPCVCTLRVIQCSRMYQYRPSNVLGRKLSGLGL